MKHFQYHISKIGSLINKGSNRTVKAKKNIISSFVLKGLSMLVSFLLIPLTLGYLNSYEYGIWLTLSAIAHWVEFFDGGLGNGLRNKLSESLANNDAKLSNSYVSTTFFSLGVIISSLFVVFLFISYYINWYELLNVDIKQVSDLNSLVVIVVGSMSLTFILKTTTYVYYAKQISSITNVVSFLSQLLSLIIIYLLTITTQGDLKAVAVVYMGVPIVILLLLYPFTFLYKYVELRPSLKYVNLSYLKDLLGIGLEFFFLKVGGMLIFTTSNVIISNVLSPKEVTNYNIAFKYFNIIGVLYSIIISPIWSAATEAYVKNDLNWLKSANKKMLGVSLMLTIMVIIAPYVYLFWVGNTIVIPQTVNILFAIYVTLINYSLCYSMFIFGMGKLRVQLVSTFVCGILFVVLSPYLTSYFDLNGMLLALILVNLPGVVLNPIQFYKLIGKNLNTESVWNK